MSDSSESNEEPPETPDGSDGRNPAHRESQPWLQDESNSAGQPAAPADDADDEPPWIIKMVGRIGLSLGFASLGLTAFGIPAMYVGLQPYGTIAITFAIIGVTVAMLFALVFQAYVGDYRIDRRGAS